MTHRAASRDFIFGLAAIGRHFGRSRSTAIRWSANEALPAAKQPSGHWVITKSLIDQWLLARNGVWVAARTSATQAEGTT